MEIILEYSEEQGAFHNNDGDQEHDNGYRPLGECTQDESSDFITFIRKNYFNMKLRFDHVKELFDEFI